MTGYERGTVKKLLCAIGLHDERHYWRGISLITRCRRCGKVLYP